MERDPPDPVLVDLEAKSPQVLFNDWIKKLDRNLVDNLGKYRKYESSSVRDLLRVVRNKVGFSCLSFARLTCYSDITS